VQDPASELSSLISRAKQLMGLIDHSQHGSIRGGSAVGSDSATTRLLQNHAFSSVGTDLNGTAGRHLVQNLDTVVEHDVCLQTAALILTRALCIEVCKSSRAWTLV
jgi:hypothetical protein